MLVQLFILSIFFVPQLKACVATIPPEEVYITTTKAISPTTTEAISPTTTEAISEPVEETTEATTEMTTEVTTAAGAGCGMCDIYAIAPEMPDPDTDFDTSPRDPVDGCQQTHVQCTRDDPLFCDSVVMTVNSLILQTIICRNLGCQRGWYT
ncbi:hypothetical protein L5515_015619 [Caenorhabditis briggsae]|uniref:DUF281 domain-containing protein n=1 Tax=Caenorhabditis briggsae TaxID=6238 RepID=A0AAE9EGB6_CAEBR|nr:hypothetical protein L5515_015619 [Caenorhabditis briggsae]